MPIASLDGEGNGGGDVGFIEVPGSKAEVGDGNGGLGRRKWDLMMLRGLTNSQCGEG